MLTTRGRAIYKKCIATIKGTHWESYFNPPKVTIRERAELDAIYNYKYDKSVLEKLVTDHMQKHLTKGTTNE